MKEQKSTFIIISNEIGMGVHVETEMGRKFTDLQGWANQFIAQEADKVILMVSGYDQIMNNGWKESLYELERRKRFFVMFV